MIEKAVFCLLLYKFFFSYNVFRYAILNILEDIQVLLSDPVHFFVSVHTSKIGMYYIDICLIWTTNTKPLTVTTDV